MSPRWTIVRNASLYFYASEPHQRPHVDVVGPDWDVKIALDSFEALNSSGKVPKATIREVLALLRAEQRYALDAFEATRQHRFPGTLEQQKEAGHG